MRSCVSEWLMRRTKVRVWRRHDAVVGLYTEDGDELGGEAVDELREELHVVAVEGDLPQLHVYLCLQRLRRRPQVPAVPPAILLRGDKKTPLPPGEEVEHGRGIYSGGGGGHGQELRKGRRGFSPPRWL